jgi:glyceraldehyde 3-phosphate dehydrogenase
MISATEKTALVVFAGGGRIGSGLCRRWLRASKVSDNLRMVAVVRGKPTDYIHTTILSDVFPDREWMRGTPYFDKNVLYATNRDGRTSAIEFVQYDGPPEQLKWGREENEHAILIEASGEMTDPKKCKKFLDGNVADQVMVTAPLKGDDAQNYPHVVFGVNEETALQSNLISWASCTTNGGMLPWYVLFLKLANLKVPGGGLLTVHAVTNSQNLLAKSVKDSKSMTTLDAIIPTSTGFAKAGGVVVYWLAKTGRDIDADIHLFTNVGGAALRIPTSTCSIVEQTAVIETDTPLNRYNLNAMFLSAALNGNLVDNLGFTLDPAVTSKVLIGEERTSIINGSQTQVIPLGNNKYLVSWEAFYDNEGGYVAQGWSIIAFVLANRQWGYLETSRLSRWVSLFTHFDPRLNLTLDSLKAKDVYTVPSGMSSLSFEEIKGYQLRDTGTIDARPYNEASRKVLKFKPPMTTEIPPEDDYAAMARWFDDYELMDKVSK